MVALVLGGTGLTGIELIALLLEEEAFSEIHVILRRQLGFTHPKLRVHMSDLENPSWPNINVDVVFCCLGTTIKKAGSKTAFKHVDVELPVFFAQKAKQNGAITFCLLTAMGSNESSFIFYNQAKGEVENRISQLAFKNLGIFRPSMLLGDRKEKRAGEKIAQVVMTNLDFLIPAKYKAIHVKQVALKMIQYALAPSQGISIIENDALLTPS